MHRAIPAGLFLLLALRVAAQKSEVTCSSPNFAWSSNDKGQDTCLIAAYLRAECQPNPTSFDLGPSNSGHYGPPTDVNKCTCSMVYYNAINACSLCGGNQTLPWSESITPCAPKDVTVAGFPEPIPAGISIPAWAYIDVTKANVFKADVAKNFSTTNHTMFSADGSSPSSSSPSASLSAHTSSLLSTRSSVPSSSSVPASSSAKEPSDTSSPPTIGPIPPLSRSPTASSASTNSAPSSLQSAQPSTQSSAAKSHSFNAGVVGSEAVISAIAVLAASAFLFAL
ncbi:hypothetical protein PsYK624_106710 [Phanerochaete sordida]|uniref:Uncharacterized protein n=1 Tax=Phanerochaete sordida TaxID=48140 RepID=A0A9P3GGR4_9APHY|nr:hypothetical protein PsYK624_106710 [Phanerochaete sordida]